MLPLLIHGHLLELTGYGPLSLFGNLSFVALYVFGVTELLVIFLHLGIGMGMFCFYLRGWKVSGKSDSLGFFP